MAEEGSGNEIKQGSKSEAGKPVTAAEDEKQKDPGQGQKEKGLLRKIRKFFSRKDDGENDDPDDVLKVIANDGERNDVGKPEPVIDYRESLFKRTEVVSGNLLQQKKIMALALTPFVELDKRGDIIKADNEEKVGVDAGMRDKFMGGLKSGEIGDFQFRGVLAEIKMPFNTRDDESKAKMFFL